MEAVRTSVSTERRTVDAAQIKAIMDATSLLELGADALNGVGMMIDAGDRALEANRREVSAIFRFFGKVLQEQAGLAYNTADEIDIKSLRGTL